MFARVASQLLLNRAIRFSTVALVLASTFVIAQKRGSDDSSLHYLPTVWDHTEVTIKWNMSGEVQAALNEGVNYLKEENPIQAILHLTEATRRDPTIWPAYYYRAMAFKQIGEFEHARADLMGVLRVQPNMFEVNLELAKIYLIDRQYEAADSYLQKALKMKPKDPMVNYFYALNDYERLYRFDALKEFEKCAKFDPEFLHGTVQIAKHEIVSVTNITAGIARLDAVLEKDSLHLDARFIRFSWRYKNQQTQEAYKDIDFLVRHAPLSMDFRIMRAYLDMQLEMYDQAFVDVRKAMEGIQRRVAMGVKQFAGRAAYEPKMLDLLYANRYLTTKLYGLNEADASIIKRSFCALVLKNYTYAVNTLLEGPVEKEKEHAIYPYLLAIAREHSDNHRAAEALYTKALELDNGIFGAHKSRAIYKIKAGAGQSAMADIEEMQMIDPNDRVTTRLRGQVLFSNGDFEKALNEFSKMLSVDSTDKDIVYFRAQCYAQMKRSIENLTDLLQLGDNTVFRHEMIHQNLNQLLLDDDPRAAEYARLILRIPRPSILTVDYEVATVKAQWVLGHWQPIIAQLTELEKFDGLDDYKNYTSALMMARGAAYLQEGNEGKAEKLLIKSMEYDANNQLVFVELGKVYLKMGNQSKAKENLEKGAKLGDKRAERLLRP